MIYSNAARYAIRYRCEGSRGQVALIVEDNTGAAYLFSDGRLQGRFRGTDACEFLARQHAGSGSWTPVPRVAPYTLAGLRHLTAPTPAGAKGGSLQRFGAGGSSRKGRKRVPSRRLIRPPAFHDCRRGTRSRTAGRMASALMRHG